MKKASSAWIKEHQKLSEFRWQQGYAAFTVSESIRPVVRQYIARQEEHHRHHSFLEEWQVFLAKHGLRD